MNKVVLIGRLTRDPELRYTQSNIPAASFTLAVNIHLFDFEVTILKPPNILFS